jgi:hypothetical protein
MVPGTLSLSQFAQVLSKRLPWGTQGAQTQGPRAPQARRSLPPAACRLPRALRPPAASHLTTFVLKRRAGQGWCRRAASGSSSTRAASSPRGPPSGTSTRSARTRTGTETPCAPVQKRLLQKRLFKRPGLGPLREQQRSSEGVRRRQPAGPASLRPCATRAALRPPGSSAARPTACLARPGKPLAPPRRRPASHPGVWGCVLCRGSFLYLTYADTLRPLLPSSRQSGLGDLARTPPCAPAGTTLTLRAMLTLRAGPFDPGASVALARRAAMGAHAARRAPRRQGLSPEQLDRLLENRAQVRADAPRGLPPPPSPY